MTSSLNICLQNATTSDTVYAFITGLAVQNNYVPFLLQSDGQTPYYPSSPSEILQPLSADCAIALGPPGSQRNVTIPQLAGGRIWFSISTPLTFLINPGPALVEPSVSNPSDPNYNLNWAFAEFTFNGGLFANISYVDFVSIPIALTLTTASNTTQHVSGMAPSGLSSVADGLRAQSDSENNPRWSSLIINDPSGGPLRVLSPNTGSVMNPTLFNGYYQPYVDDVWSRYTPTPLSVDTQAGFGSLSGTVDTASNSLILTGGDGTPEPFTQPTAGDIFSCSTGPFATGADAQRNALIPRLAAAFNRSILLLSDDVPGGVQPAQYYTDTITNHYARVVHAANLDGRGYAFPYDDVNPNGGGDVAGVVQAGDPVEFTVAVGGAGAYV